MLVPYAQSNKKLVQERISARKHDTCSKNLHKFLVQDSGAYATPVSLEKMTDAKKNIEKICQ